MSDIHLACPQCKKGEMGRFEWMKNPEGVFVDKVKCNKCGFYLSVKRTVTYIELEHILEKLKTILVGTD